MARQQFYKFLRILPFSIGMGLFVSSVSGVLNNESASEMYIKKVDPLIEKYVLGKGEDGGYISTDPDPMSIDDRLDLIADLHGLRFGMDEQGIVSARRYRLYGGFILLIIGSWIMRRVKKPVA